MIRFEFIYIMMAIYGQWRDKGQDREETDLKKKIGKHFAIQ